MPCMLFPYDIVFWHISHERTDYLDLGDSYMYKYALMTNSKKMYLMVCIDMVSVVK